MCVFFNFYLEIMMMMSSGLTMHQPIKGHLHQNGVLTWFCNEMVITIHICIKCKTRTNFT